LIQIRTVPAQARRNFRQQKALWEEVMLSWSPEGLDVVTASAQAHRAWSHYLKWREIAAHFLIHQTDQLYIIVPKRAFVSAEA
ncbi:YcxB family protein, partial [Stenotrophomonas maltophilia]|uniref:YcxB family protein n=2 Tax=Gammaproteobacteria TaxID=1236 RepID=UPI0013DB5FCB